MNIRFAVIEDLNIIVDIYNQAIRAGNATAHTSELHYQDMVDWFLQHDKNSYPIYVIAISKIIIGWGSLSPYREGREGLRQTAEISYYLDYKYHGQGFGKKLIAYIINDCERMGIKNLFALMLEINHNSIVLLEKFGFSKWGLMPDVVNLHGNKYGHLIYGKNLEQETKP